MLFSQIMALEQHIQLEKTSASLEKENLVRKCLSSNGKTGIKLILCSHHCGLFCQFNVLKQ